MKPALLPSTSPYDDATRAALVESLSALTLDTLALSLIVWRAHRSLRGALFSDLHTLFGDFAQALDTYADKLPEASAALGGGPVGTAEEIAEGNRLDAYPLDVTGGFAHCREITVRVSALGAYVAEGIAQASEMGAAVELRLLTKLLAKLNYYGWQIGAHVTETVPPDDDKQDDAPESAQEPAGADDPESQPEPVMAKQKPNARGALRTSR